MCWDPITEVSAQSGQFTYIAGLWVNPHIRRCRGQGHPNGLRGLAAGAGLLGAGRRALDGILGGGREGLRHRALDDDLPGLRFGFLEDPLCKVFALSKLLRKTPCSGLEPGKPLVFLVAFFAS